MTKVEKGGDCTVKMWSLNQKISGLFFLLTKYSCSKYGRDMEIEASKIFIEFIKGKHTAIKLSDLGYLLMRHYYM